MAEGRPRLVAVGEPSPAAEVSASGRRPARNRLAVVLLCTALVVCAIGWLSSRREADRLSGELATSQQALAAATALLEAAEARRVEVKSHVQALAADATAIAGRLGELEALVADDLEPAAHLQPTGNEAPTAD